METKPLETNKLDIIDIIIEVLKDHDKDMALYEDQFETSLDRLERNLRKLEIILAKIENRRDKKR